MSLEVCVGIEERKLDAVLGRVPFHWWSMGTFDASGMLYRVYIATNPSSLDTPLFVQHYGSPDSITREEAYRANDLDYRLAGISGDIIKQLYEGFLAFWRPLDIMSNMGIGPIVFLCDMGEYHQYPLARRKEIIERRLSGTQELMTFHAFLHLPEYHHDAYENRKKSYRLLPDRPGTRSVYAADLFACGEGRAL